MSLRRKFDPKLIIFSLVGVFNTLFDLVLYVVILNASNSILIANIAATSAALIGSYFLNARLTFKTKRWTTRTFISFVAVTLFGLWVLQTGLIYGFNHLLSHVPEHLWQRLGGLEHTAKAIVPKLLATVFTFVWNFVWYNKVIFKHESTAVQAALASEDL